MTTVTKKTTHVPRKRIKKTLLGNARDFAETAANHVRDQVENPNQRQARMARPMPSALPSETLTGLTLSL